VVLINCGGCLNLLELLQPSDDDDAEGSAEVRGHHSRVTFFIVDSQRPLELDNVYNQDQVHVVLREGEGLEVPDFDDIYASDMVRLNLRYHP
jgi:cell division control protein 45